MFPRTRTLTFALACCLLPGGFALAETPHQTYHRFHHGNQASPPQGAVVYVQPSYPFTRHYIQPGQDPRFLHYRRDGSLTGHAPPRRFHHHHPHGFPHHDYGHRSPDYPTDYPAERPANRLVQDGSRLSLLDRDGRSIRQIYLRPGSRWERQFGYIIVSTRSRLEVYDRDLHRISGMHLPAGASFSFRHDGIVVNTRFYTEIYDYHLRRLDRFRS